MVSMAAVGAVAASVLALATGTTALADTAGSETDVSALGNTWAYLYNSNSPYGTSAQMVHVDDGDIFRIYDTYADGHGVRGTLQRYNSVTGNYETVKSKYNGGGYISYAQFTFDVWSVNSYRMRVCTVDGEGDETPVACSAWKSFTE
ncbi:hypothetical protein GCM10010358_80000 [Streptomyces minutiscleroticus]|uniref:Secreted protein n=2 Tax=Streptomyces minutiscleroticus TaxID=68238 RepID=A0A918P3I4_9ACTN|nr:hypothetical protein GCM10010358_80000 [Streptomyces minutiscleroticus]